jgi:hypothetical protein
MVSLAVRNQLQIEQFSADQNSPTMMFYELQFSHSRRWRGVMFGPANLKNNTNVEVFDDKGTEFCKIVDGKGELTDLRCFQKQSDPCVPVRFVRVIQANNVSLVKFRMTQEDTQKVVIDFPATNSTFCYT